MLALFTLELELQLFMYLSIEWTNLSLKVDFNIINFMAKGIFTTWKTIAKADGWKKDVLLHADVLLIKTIQPWK
jgi:hypothetical protein